MNKSRDAGSLVDIQEFKRFMQSEGVRLLDHGIKPVSTGIPEWLRMKQGEPGEGMLDAVIPLIADVVDFDGFGETISSLRIHGYKVYVSGKNDTCIWVYDVDNQNETSIETRKGHYEITRTRSGNIAMTLTKRFRQRKIRDNMQKRWLAFILEVLP